MFAPSATPYPDMKTTSTFIPLALLSMSLLHAQPANSNGKGHAGNSGNANAGGTTTGAVSPTGANGSAGSTSGATNAGNTGVSGSPATAVSATDKSALRAAAAFELPRLKAGGNATNPVAVPKGRATKTDLAADSRGQARRAASQGLDYLAIDGGTAWAADIRGAEPDITFVSFFAYVSEGSTIDIAGAKIVIRPAKEPGCVQMQIGRPGPQGMQWRNFGGPVRQEPYDGAPLAALPVLTVRLDGTAGIWDLYVGPRLGAFDIPLGKLPTGANREFRLHAGPHGARVCGLVSSDDNPLFVDANRNGIDDAFEAQRDPATSLKGRKAGIARSELAKAWQQDQQARNVQPWPVRRPLPDNAKGKGKNG